MARLYQPTKNNPYRLRDSVYWRVVDDIRRVGKYYEGYYDDFPEYAPTTEQTDYVMQAFDEEPEEYKQMIFDAVVNNVALPKGYRNKTTTLQKAHFIYRCAELLGYPLGPTETVTVTYNWK